MLCSGAASDFYLHRFWLPPDWLTLTQKWVMQQKYTLSISLTIHTHTHSAGGIHLILPDSNIGTDKGIRVTVNKERIKNSGIHTHTLLIWNKELFKRKVSDLSPVNKWKIKSITYYWLDNGNGFYLVLIHSLWYRAQSQIKTGHICICPLTLCFLWGL